MMVTAEMIRARRRAGTPWKVLERETGLSRQRLHAIAQSETITAAKQAWAAIQRVTSEGGAATIEFGDKRLLSGRMTISSGFTCKAVLPPSSK